MTDPAAKQKEISDKVERTLDYLASSPKHGSTTVERAVYKEMLLSKDGWIMSHGSMYDIKGESLGAGVYKVRLEKRL